MNNEKDGATNRQPPTAYRLQPKRIVKKEKLTGVQVTRKLQKIMVLVSGAGIPIVQLFMSYVTGGGFSGLKENFGIFAQIIGCSVVIVAIAMYLHAWYIKSLFREAAEFLDNDRPRKGEPDDKYYKRVSRAINCALRFPIKGAGLSLITWPAVLTTVLTIVWAGYFKFPVELAIALVAGALCAGVVVTNFEFYIFKKSLQPAIRQMLSLYPSYWKDPTLEEVRFSLRRKMMVSVVLLMMTIVIMQAIFNNIEGSKALMFQWGEFQKDRIRREIKLIGSQFEAASTPEQRAAVINMLDDKAGGKFYMFDNMGNNLLPAEPDAKDKPVLTAIAKRSKQKSREFLLVAYPKDGDITLSVEALRLNINTRVELPGSNLVIIARIGYGHYIGEALSMVLASAAVMLVALIVGVFFTAVTSGDITVPMGDIVNIVKKVSQGELREDVDMVTHDEMGVLAVNFKVMVKNLREMILKVRNASGSVEGATYKIVAGFSGVSDGSRVQSRAVEEASASMDRLNSSITGIGENMGTLASATQESSASIFEMSANIKEVADSVDNLNQSVEETTTSITQMATSIKQVAGNIEILSRKAENTVGSVTEMEASIKEVQAGAKVTAEISGLVALNAEGGKVQVQAAIEGVGRARESSEHAVKVISELANRAEEISNVITVINYITDQTNLLALNAAIIAAKAGEYGRGFAVVADEIKELAERTSMSTGEIGKLIGSVQQMAKEAVDTVQVGYQVVEDGVDLTKKAGQSLDKILDSARLSMQHTYDIARATVEQAERIRSVLQFFEEIFSSIKQLEAATREQSKGSIQIMRNAERMREITKQVKNATQEQYSGSKQIIMAIENINEIIRFINKSQGEQIENNDRVASAVAEIRRIATQNEKGVEEMFQASANLSSLAEELRDIVGTFKVVEQNTEAGSTTV